MKFKKIISFLIIPFLIIFLSGCVVNKDGKMVLKKNEPFKHDTPLIKTDVKKLGKKELEKSSPQHTELRLNERKHTGGTNAVPSFK